MDATFSQKVFLDADQEIVPYDGSAVTWRVSAYAVVKRGEEVFLVKDAGEKLYDIVGGGIEMGEDIEQALQREALEEGGIHVHVGKILHAQLGWFYHRKQKAFFQTLQLFYAAELESEAAAPTEKSIEWRGFVPLNEIGKTYHLPPVVEEVIHW